MGVPYLEYISFRFNGNGWFFGGPVRGMPCVLPGQTRASFVQEACRWVTKKVNDEGKDPEPARRGIDREA